MKAFALHLGAALIVIPISSLPLLADAVIVHEWGTFTCLQDDEGQAIGGINVDDEPVPVAYSENGGQWVASQYSRGLGNFGLPPYAAGKGWASGDPAVTMRLETPVIYIYPPKGHAPQSVPPLDVHVDFHGGFLTQFYPYAVAVPFNGQGKITDQSSSSLDWAGVRLGSKEKPVETDEKVWTTPREVSAPILQVMMHWTNGNGQFEPGVVQAEHFLFYRGVGHLNSPLEVVPYQAHGMLSVSARGMEPVSVNAAWVVQIRADGTVASHAVTQTYTIIDAVGPNKAKPVSSTYSMTHLRGSFFSGGNMPLADVSAAFSDSDFSADNLTKLKSSMHDALVKEGLYDDEATAMLKTWELSYFKSPGLRFFYIAPREWVDKVLPLSVTGATTEITRVMVGRIELVTDSQKAALQRLSDGPCPDLPAFKKAALEALSAGHLSNTEADAYYRGEKPLTDLGLPVPPLIRDYLGLGRFRDALVMHEFWEQKSAPLAQFINQNGIAPAGLEIKARDLVPLPPGVSLKNPVQPSAETMHL